MDGIRRHIQYLGKIMGAMSEEEVDGIKQALIGIVGTQKSQQDENLIRCH